MFREECPTINLKQLRLTDATDTDSELFRVYEWPKPLLYDDLGFEVADRL